MLTNRSMPSCAVIPVLAYQDVRAATDWLCATFGFTVRWRAGTHRAQLAVGDAAIAVTEVAPARGEAAAPGPARPNVKGDSVMVRVDDVDRHHEHARQRGARIVQAPADHPYGERQYTAQDLAGRLWTFTQSIADVAPEAWGGVTSGG